ncbi:MAG: hypothetical protein ACNA8R_04195 [Nitriliruptoraceae bacterium]
MAIEVPRLVAVEGRALDGTLLELPAQLPGRRTVVVIAFRQRQQRDVDRWIDLAVALGVPATPLGAAVALETAVIELPVLGRRYLGARRFIDGGMAASIADPAVLARTITVYTDAAAFRRRCGIPTAEEVTVLLAGRDGVATWYRTGPPAPADRGALADALAAGVTDT